MKSIIITKSDSCASRGKQSGMILVVTLAIIVLVTVAVLAFFSHAIANRQVESSRTNRTAANLLAHTGQDYVTGLFLAEISDAANSSNNTVNGVTMYFPKSLTNSLARRAVGSGIEPTNSSFFNLIRQSVPGVDPNASTNNTLETARNGRMITAERWNAPRLLGGQGFQTNQLPNWIYVTRSGGITNAVSSGNVKDVIGRFAYNVYDIGGLLDVSAAGYPSGMPETNISLLEGTVAGADLTRLPGGTAVGDLVTFRNPGTTTATYTNAVSAFARKGFLVSRATNSTTGTVFTNNAFMNRQDLLRYARLQNTALTNALPYLTQFSRSVNAPSWTPPAAPANTNPKIPDVRFSSAGNIIHYLDDGTIEPFNATETAYSYKVKAGDPLVQRRFSLARLAWLTPKGPSAELSTTDPQYNAGGTAETIRACFGLEWAATKERWDYVGPTGNALRDEIADLAAVASENREPNFFELLKAGILDGSVGSYLPEVYLNGDNKNIGDQVNYLGSEDTRTVQRNKDLQLLRIGANIIDCADADNYPTVLALDQGSIEVEEAGVEDLPYLYAMSMTGLREGDENTTPRRLLSGDIVWFPLFYNPHRSNTPDAPPPGPEAVRLEFASGILTQVEYNSEAAKYPDDATSNPAYFPMEFSGLGNIEIPQADFESFRLGPKARLAANHPQRLGTLARYFHPYTGVDSSNIDAAYADVLGFRIFSWQKNYVGYPENPKDPNYPTKVYTTDGLWYLKETFKYEAYYMYFEQLNIVMRYKTPRGQWKTYATMGGNEALPDSGLNGGYNDGAKPKTAQVQRCGKHFHEAGPTKDNHDLNRTYNLFTYDPRSSRFGPAAVRNWNFGDLPVLSYAQAMSGTYAPPGAFPEAGKDESMIPVMDNAWPSNFPDADGVFRPADGFLGKALSANPANPYEQKSGSVLNASHSSRPVMLQRPFRSVAELGYVFRDSPWKTLSFFDETSADGALLDLFAVRDEPAVTAGRVSLNTRWKEVQEALLSKIAMAPDGTVPLPEDQVRDVAGAFSESYAFSAGLPATPALNLSDLNNFMSSTDLPAGLDAIKFRREAVVRALADASQTRTWNVLIDVVAQAGRFTGSALEAGDFVVEGESRSWDSMAIDRYTGRIVDRQTEQVNE